jgi:hypothetical protein
MTHHEYTVAVTVEEKIVDKTFNYSTVVLVEATDIEHAEVKVLEWFDKQDRPGQVEHKVQIVKTIPKLINL